MEALMQYVWQFRLWPAADMYTVDGRRIEVLDPGILNHDSGPDFFNAKVLIDGCLWVGNIEIHTQASQWYNHHHDGNPAYDNVVLHVVDTSDAEVYRTNGDKIPQMIMRCTPDFSVRYNNMVNNPLRELACGNALDSLPRIYLNDWLTALGYERLYEKADRVHALLERCNGNWAEAIYVTLARALGFSTNSQPFELLALSTPLKYMLHYTDSLVSIEAMLFGQAGLLENLDPCGDPYLIRLIDEYRFLATKYSLKRNTAIMWKMSRMRPQNFPHRRIAALAQLIYHNFIFSDRIIEIADEDAARHLFDIELQGYWATHYNFTPTELTATYSKALSRASTTVLIINVVVPVIFAFSLSTANDRRQQFAIELLQSLKPESNRIIDMYARAGIDAGDAFTTQAMIQLKRTYCEQRKCLFCRIGHKLLSAQVKRS